MVVQLAAALMVLVQPVAALVVLVQPVAALVVRQSPSENLLCSLHSTGLEPTSQLSLALEKRAGSTSLLSVL